jgi:hypothetical protein
MADFFSNPNGFPVVVVIWQGHAPFTKYSVQVKIFLQKNSSIGSSEFGMAASWDLTNKENIFGLEKVQQPAK